MASVSDTRVGDMKERFHAKLAEVNKSDCSDFLKEEKYYDCLLYTSSHFREPLWKNVFDVDLHSVLHI